ncbi:MAG TPA: ATP-binding protein [Burkholderiales bacterium]|nr:ATP-binding protein [Burkholderiales bacterium]
MGRLFWKIFSGFWLALVVAAVGTGTIVWLKHEELASAPLAMGPRAGYGIEMAASMLREDGVDALRGWIAHRRRPMQVFVVDDAGRDVLGRPVAESVVSSARRVAERGEPGARVVTTPDGERYLLFAPLPPGMHRAAQPPLSFWQLIAIGAATSLAFSALLAWYLAWPIRSLRWAFDSAAAGRLETRVSPRIGSRRDEIADLGRDFDRMAQHLQSLVSAQRRLLHDVSHELRSPLARLQAAVGLARQDPTRMEATLERIERETNRLDAMVGEILTLARLESRTSAPAKEPVDFAHLVASIAEDARFEAEAAGRRLALDIRSDARVSGDPALLHRAVENVVRNAVKFTAPGTAVDVSLASADGRAILKVDDHGPGIAPDELPKVFEPFYRAAGTDASGFGLGLAIAQRAVEAHGGTIRAANIPGGGLSVEISLPSFTQR